ncbi:hypothetical protein C0991_008935, partial [Blastosporella zonata]
MDVPTLFASNLCTFSNNAVTDLQYAGLTRDEATVRDAQWRAHVVQKREKRAAVPATQAARAVDDDKEGPTAGPLQTTPAALPTLGTEDDEGEVLGEGILGVPRLDEGDDGAPAAPEGVEGDERSESA